MHGDLEKYRLCIGDLLQMANIETSTFGEVRIMGEVSNIELNESISSDGEVNHSFYGHPFLASFI